jgi:hypothetical protein
MPLSARLQRPENGATPIREVVVSRRAALPWTLLLTVVLVLAALPAGADRDDNMIIGRANGAKAYHTSLYSTNNTATLSLFNRNGGDGAPALRLHSNKGPALEITSAVLIPNLNADLLDGNEAAAFSAADHDHDTDYAALGHDHSGVYMDALACAAEGDILEWDNTGTTWTCGAHDHDAEYLAVDGKADDADLLDGMDSASFATATHGHVVGTDTFLSTPETLEIEHSSSGDGTTMASVSVTTPDPCGDGSTRYTYLAQAKARIVTSSSTGAVPALQAGIEQDTVVITDGESYRTKNVPVGESWALATDRILTDVAPGGNVVRFLALHDQVSGVTVYAWGGSLVVWDLGYTCIS